MKPHSGTQNQKFPSRYFGCAVSVDQVEYLDLFGHVLMQLIVLQQRFTILHLRCLAWTRKSKRFCLFNLILRQRKYGFVIKTRSGGDGYPSLIKRAS